jgi:hypothetical protein
MRCIPVSDPFGVTGDPAMPSLELALDPAVVKAEFKRGLPTLSGSEGKVRVGAIRVTRYKPGKRCMIEYDVKVERPDADPPDLTLIGKIRARRFGMGDHRLLQSLWDAGFDSQSADGISVARPIGVIPRLNMWLQAKAPGVVATDLLATADGAALARRVAEAAHKLHRVSVPTERRQTMADELRILHGCLRNVAMMEPRWANRLERLFTRCEALGRDLVEPVPCGIHRDFYADQIIVDGSRLHLIDFDLYCLGDPGLDIGNFLGHVQEQSLRTHGDATILSEIERALEERFVELSGETVRSAVRAYKLLTLARHIYVSRCFLDRRPWTESILALCEERLGVPSHAHAALSVEEG